MNQSSEQAPPRHKRKRRIISLFLGLALIAGILLGALVLLSRNGVSAGPFTLEIDFERDPSASQQFFSHCLSENTNEEQDLVLAHHLAVLVPGGALELTFQRVRSRQAAREKLPRSIEDLVAALRSKDKWLAFCSAELLSEQGGAALSALPEIFVLSQRLPGAFFFATPIARGAPVQALPIITNRMAHHPPPFPHAYLRLLGELETNARPALPLLFEKFKSASSAEKVAIGAVINKVSGSHNEVLSLLLEELRKVPDPLIQNRIIRALADFRPAPAEALPEILQQLRTNRTETVLHSCLAFLKKVPGTPNMCLPAILPHLPPTDPPTVSPLNFAALQILELYGQLAVPYLLPYYQSTNAFLREAGVSALQGLGPDAAVALKLFLSDLHTTRPARILAACKVLSGLGEGAKPALPQLRALLHYPDHRVKIAAAETLWRLNSQPQSLIPILVEVLNDRSAPITSIQSATWVLAEMVSSKHLSEPSLALHFRENSLARFRFVNYRRSWCLKRASAE